MKARRVHEDALQEFLGFGKKAEMKPEQKPEQRKFIRSQKKVEKGLKVFGVTPETERGREQRANQDLQRLKLQLQKRNANSPAMEDIMECPYCDEEFLLEDVDLYEDSEGQFIICPFCEEDINISEKKEYTMDEQIFESLLENISQLNEEEVDEFVDNLTEEEVDQMLEFCDIIEEMEAEEDVDAGELAEGLIDSILEGTDPSEIADILAGYEE